MTYIKAAFPVSNGRDAIAPAMTRAICLLAVLCLPLSAAIVSGDILISNHGGNNVQLLDPTTGTVTTLTSTPNTPIGLAFDASGNLYINQDDGIMKYVPSTNTLTPLFTGAGQREGLAFDPTTNNLFSVSFGGNHIEEVDLAGNLIRSFSIPGTTALLGIATRGGALVVTDNGTGNVYLGTTTGSTFSLVGNVDGGNTYAPDIDAAGNIFVNDFARGQTVEFMNLGGGLFGPKTTFISGLSEPANGLSIGDDGSFTISEFGGNAISVWNSNGTLRQRFPGVANPDELVVFAPQRSGGTPEPSSLVLVSLSSIVAGVGFMIQRRLASTRSV